MVSSLLRKITNVVCEEFTRSIANNQATFVTIHDYIKLLMNTESAKMLYSANYIIILSRKNNQMQVDKCLLIQGMEGTINYLTSGSGLRK